MKKILTIIAVAITLFYCGALSRYIICAATCGSGLPEHYGYRWTGGATPNCRICIQHERGIKPNEWTGW